ncbi:MAG TPA: threonine synthase, partial [Candidatus Xenobia bacterium]
LAGATVHGARILAIEGNFDLALKMVRELSERHPIALVNSVNPYRIEGQKTAAFEVVQALKGRTPEMVVLPVGNAGNITAWWKGFTEYKAAGTITETPRMIGVQASGAAPLVRNQPVEDPQTLATAIRIGNPASWQGATTAVAESHGGFYAVTDEQILEAYRFLATREGLFAEPASCAPIAWLLGKDSRHVVKGGETIVCVLTGHGLKDPDTALRSAAAVQTIAATQEALDAVLTP